MNQNSTKVDELIAAISNHPISAMIIVFGIVIIATWTFADSFKNLYNFARDVFRQPPAPKALITVNEQDNGCATLTFKFFNVPEDINVDWISLSFEQTTPEVAVEGNPSTQVQSVRYDVAVPRSILDTTASNLEIETRLIRSPNEPYALAELILWWEGENSSIGLAVLPKFFDAQLRQIPIETEPPSIELRLTHYSAVNAIRSEKLGRKP